MGGYSKNGRSALVFLVAAKELFETVLVLSLLLLLQHNVQPRRIVFCEMLGMGNDLITWMFVVSMRPYTLLLRRCGGCAIADELTRPDAANGAPAVGIVVEPESDPGFGPVVVVVVRIKSRKLLCDPVVNR